MTSQTDQLKFALAEIARSKKWRSDESYDENWRRWIDLYRGYQYEGAKSLNDRLIINIVFATVNVLVPAVSVNNPKFTISARKPDSQAQAMLTRKSSTTCGKSTGTSRTSASPSSTSSSSATAGTRSATSGSKDPESKNADDRVGTAPPTPMRTRKASMTARTTRATSSPN